MITGDNGVLNKAKTAKTKTGIEQDRELIGVAVAETMDETLRLDLDELKQNIVKELPEASIIGDEFPIKVVTENGTYTVDAKGKVERLSGISLDTDKLLLQIVDGEKEEKTLNAILTDIEGEITWSSSNQGVATVDNSGTVKAVAEGTALITATCGDYNSECTVTVKNVVSISSITLKINGVAVTSSSEAQEITEDSSLEIIAETNTDATEEIVWEWSNQSIVKVDGSGTRNLKGLVTVANLPEADEEVTITAKAKKVSESVKIKVKVPIKYEAKDITKDLMTKSVVVNYNEREWYIFYADNTNIYLILKDTTTNPTDNTKTVNPPINGSVKGDYSNSTSVLADIDTNEETASRFPAVKDGWLKKLIDSGLTFKGPGVKAALYMLDSNVWADYKGELGDYAIRRTNIRDAL